MRALVIFHTRYGNTEKIARSLAAGLAKAGVETASLYSKDVLLASLKGCDLICLGAPTEGFSASAPMKEFLKRVEQVDFHGKYGFAFDTVADPGTFGSAAEFIEDELRGYGLKILAPHESAIIFNEGTPESPTLKEGEEARFEEIGLRLGRDVA